AITHPDQMENSGMHGPNGSVDSWLDSQPFLVCSLSLWVPMAIWCKIGVRPQVFLIGRTAGGSSASGWLTIPSHQDFCSRRRFNTAKSFGLELSYCDQTYYSYQYVLLETTAL